LPESPCRFAQLKMLNKQLVLAQQAAEWRMRSIRGLFGQLKLPLPASDPQLRADILQVVCQLHQL
jgi:hypothetical protein